MAAPGDQPSGRLRQEREADHDDERWQNADGQHYSPLQPHRRNDLLARKTSDVSCQTQSSLDGVIEPSDWTISNREWHGLFSGGTALRH